MDFDFDSKLEILEPVSQGLKFGNFLRSLAESIIIEEWPDLQRAFPTEKKFKIELNTDNENWLALRIEFLKHASAVMLGVPLKEEYVNYIINLYQNKQNDKDGLFVESFLNEECTFDKFVYVGPVKNRLFCAEHLTHHFICWLDEIVVPRVLEHNRDRVRRALPEAPGFDCTHISKCLWVLECDAQSRQGSAFALDHIGLVTCCHVLGVETKAFRYDCPGQKYPINVIQQNSSIDLAIISLPISIEFKLSQGDSDHLNLMDHILIAGHPNYRLGDSPMFYPGIIVGFRPYSGIRRLLTNAPIIAGTSGGPALDRQGNVIGVAVTGAERLDEASTTEDMGIVPIETLGYLGS